MSLVNQGVHGSNSMVIKVRGREVGRANGVDVNVDFGLQPVPEGIGSIMPAEHVSLDYRADISVNTFLIRLRTTGAKAGIQDVLGTPINDDVLAQEPFTLEVLDKVTGQRLFVAEECSWASVGVSIRQGAITGKDARCSAIRVRQAAGYGLVGVPTTL
jgi:hypothetical protein